MLHSSCLCGAVRWEVGGELQFMSHCHCSRCRKAHGTPFSTAVGAPASEFRLQGEDSIARWESPEGAERFFCKHCGSAVPGLEWQGLMFVPAGNFDDDPVARPAFHIFVGSKAPWYEITDALPRFEAYPDGIDVQILPDRPPLDPPGGARGSCLCGEVGFVVDADFIRGHFCHCQRCRKARSAAHASNLLTAVDGVRFTRGAERLRTYKLPEARFFAQVFCTNCGGKLPRLDADRGIAIIPMGALDDDPKLDKISHIFVASKAPWFEITDDYPQFAERPG